jgi:hypothetical protein
MALIFTDPNTAGPFATFQAKDVYTKAFKLTAANFSTTGVNTNVGAFPADASFLSFEYWVKTALDNTATSPTLSIGNVSAGTQFASAAAVTNTVGTQGKVTPVTGILQPYNVPNTTDIPLWVKGGCSTANPNNAEVYLVVYYTR